MPACDAGPAVPARRDGGSEQDRRRAEDGEGEVAETGEAAGDGDGVAEDGVDLQGGAGATSRAMTASRAQGHDDAGAPPRSAIRATTATTRPMATPGRRTAPGSVGDSQHVPARNVQRPAPGWCRPRTRGATVPIGDR